MAVVIFSKFSLNQSSPDTELEKEITKTWLSAMGLWPPSQRLMLNKYIPTQLQVFLASIGQFGPK